MATYFTFDIHFLKQLPNFFLWSAPDMCFHIWSAVVFLAFIVPPMWKIQIRNARTGLIILLIELGFIYTYVTFLTARVLQPHGIFGAPPSWKALL